MSPYLVQRMLIPYHGIVNLVEIDGADAVCRDGVDWMLCIQGGTEPEPGNDGFGQQVSLPDLEFGDWSRATGLKRTSVRHVTDYHRLDQIGGRLLEAVKWRTDRKAALVQRDRPGVRSPGAARASAHAGRLSGAPLRAGAGPCARLDTAGPPFRKHSVPRA